MKFTKWLGLSAALMVTATFANPAYAAKCGNNSAGFNA
jgi:hypothetical protein